MIVITAQDLRDTVREVSGPGWRSARLIVRQDGMGYSVHETTVTQGAELHLEYKQHFETNYCVAGEGEVEDLATGEVHVIEPGTIYALNLHDKHVLRAMKGDLKFVCVFNPPLVGNETHNAEGSYELD